MGKDPLDGLCSALLALEDVYPCGRRLHGLSFCDVVVRYAAHVLELDAVFLAEATQLGRTASVINA